MPLIVFGQNPNMKRLLIRKATASTPLMTFDATNHGSGATFSGGNLNCSNASLGIAIGNVFHSTTIGGKFYCEIKCTYQPVGDLIGFIASNYTAANLNQYMGYDAREWALELHSAYVYNNNTPIRSGFTGAASGYTYSFAFDATAGNFYLGIIVTGVTYWFNTSGTTTTFSLATPLNLSPISGSFTVGVGYGAGGVETYTMNSGQSAYTGTVPSGYGNF